MSKKRPWPQVNLFFQSLKRGGGLIDAISPQAFSSICIFLKVLPSGKPQANASFVILFGDREILIFHDSSVLSFLF